MNPELITPAPIFSGANTGKTSSNPLNSVSRNEFEYGICPSGGDTDSCIRATKTATIISRDNCNVTVRSEGKDKTYALCQ